METMEITTAAAAAGKPGYKLTKLGWIPEEWDITTLADIVDPERNITYGIVQAGPHVEDGVPYIKTGDLSAEIVPDTLSRTSHEIAQQYSRSEVYPGDIVFSLRGDVGASRIVPAELPVANLTQGTARIAVPGDSDRDFVFQQICSPDVAKRLLDQAKGSTFQEITLKALRSFTIVWPPERERSAIAEVLTSFDKTTRNLSKLLIAKRTYKRGLMQQLLTGQRRFPEFQGEAVTVSKLAPYLKEVSVRNRQLTVTRVLSVTNNRGFIDQRDQFEREVASADRSNYKIVRRGQFGYNPARINVGSIALLDKFEEGALSPLYIIFETVASRLDTQYVKHFFQTDSFNQQLKQQLQGGVRDMLSFSGMCQLQLFIPSLPEQQRIAAVLTACDQEIELLQTQLRQWQQQKKGLMQQMLMGQLRVNTAL